MRRYGWRPSLPDPRDVQAPPVPEGLVLPSTFSLRPDMPPVYDQGQLGSCTANAIAAAYQFKRIMDGTDFGVPSRLFIYYCERVREGTVTQDAGAYGRDGFASLRKSGVPPETLWPYEISRFAEAPSETAYQAAKENRIAHYVHPSLSQTCIQKLIYEKQPVAFGFTVFKSFESISVEETGIVPMPQPGEEILGGHEVLAVGWDSNGLECRNSWGPAWGSEGYFWLPWAYVMDGYASDFRAIAL